MFAIEMMLGNGWENVWTADGEPMLFDTFEEAAADLSAHLQDIREAHACGDLSDDGGADEFRIVEVLP